MGHRSLHPVLHYLRRLSTPAPGCESDDAQLLGRYLGHRDEAAFTAIVRRYGAMVWGVCARRLGETPDAEDAFQATFLVLVRKAPNLRGPDSLGPWLYGVANRTALKAKGRNARQVAREQTRTHDAGCKLREEPNQESLWDELRPVLDEELNRLPEKYRRPLLLCYLQGLSNEEAAQALGCPKGTVFSRLSRARDLLRQRLARRGVGVTGTVLATVLTGNAATKAVPVALLEATIGVGLLSTVGRGRPHHDPAPRRPGRRSATKHVAEKSETGVGGAVGPEHCWFGGRLRHTPRGAGRAPQQPAPGRRGTKPKAKPCQWCPLRPRAGPTRGGQGQAGCTGTSSKGGTGRPRAHRWRAGLTQPCQFREGWMTLIRQYPKHSTTFGYAPSDSPLELNDRAFQADGGGGLAKMRAGPTSTPNEANDPRHCPANRLGTDPFAVGGGVRPSPGQCRDHHGGRRLRSGWG